MTEAEKGKAKATAKATAAAGVGAGVGTAGGASVGVLELAAKGAVTGLSARVARSRSSSARSRQFSALLNGSAMPMKQAAKRECLLATGKGVAHRQRF